MRAPRVRGSNIDARRMHDWVEEFAGYRHAVTENRIDRWLAQFDGTDRDLAARVLDCVDYVPYERIADAFRSLLRSLPGWNFDKTQRQGKWRFVPFSVSAGESGDSMLHQFRVANKLGGRKHDELFVHTRDLLREELRAEDSVVFVDDFAGTGDQVSTAWTAQMAELLPGSPNTYLILVAASVSGRQAISRRTGLTVAPSFELTESDDIFSQQCAHFNADEKATLLRYCQRADRHLPRGYGDCGFVIVFAHRCPNNAIPILHAHNGRWSGLFRRHH